jgi:hypothetical protein
LKFDDDWSIKKANLLENKKKTFSPVSRLPLEGFS